MLQRLENQSISTEDEIGMSPHQFGDEFEGLKIAQLIIVAKAQMDDALVRQLSNPDEFAPLELFT